MEHKQGRHPGPRETIDAEASHIIKGLVEIDMIGSVSRSRRRCLELADPGSLNTIHYILKNMYICLFRQVSS